jgi:hypothetical protein
MSAKDARLGAFWVGQKEAMRRKKNGTMVWKNAAAGAVQ